MMYVSDFTFGKYTGQVFALVNTYSLFHHGIKIDVFNRRKKVYVKPYPTKEVLGQATILETWKEHMVALQ